MRVRGFVFALIGAVVSLSLMASSASAADTPELPPNEMSESNGLIDMRRVEVTERGYAELVAALKSDGAVSDADGTITYNVEGFGPVSMPEGGSAQIGGGGGASKPYISFSQTDQKAIMAGSGAMLTAAICAVPAVGWVACGVAGALVAAAFVYLKDRGVCPKSKKNLRIYIKSRYAGCYK